MAERVVRMAACPCGSVTFWKRALVHMVPHGKGDGTIVPLDEAEEVLSLVEQYECVVCSTRYSAATLLALKGGA